MFDDFWEPFWHRFSRNFDTSRFLIICMKPNGILLFSPSKPLKNHWFFDQFSIKFLCFFRTAPGEHFSRQKRGFMLKTMILGPPSDFPGSQKPPLDLPFSAKKWILNHTAFVGEPSGDRPGRDRAPKTPQIAFLLIFMDFGWIFYPFCSFWAPFWLLFSPF